MKKIITALISMVVVILSMSASPANAGNGYEDFGTNNWWNTETTYSGVPAPFNKTYLWENYPILCSQNAPDAATNPRTIEVLWGHRDTLPSKRDENVAAVRTMAAMVSSGFAASAKRYINNDNDNYTRSLTPRWLTNASSCKVQISNAPIPGSVLDSSDQSSLMSWLGQNYTDPMKKYVLIVQKDSDSAVPNCGWSYNSGTWYDDTRPGHDNRGNNEAGYAILDGPNLSNGADIQTNAEGCFFHEVVHMLGAMHITAPHFNSQNPGHPTDCWDVLCYEQGGFGQTVMNTCDNKKKNMVRLDCHNNDYFSVAGDNGLAKKSWTSQWWNVGASQHLYGYTTM